MNGGRFYVIAGLAILRVILLSGCVNSPLASLDSSDGDTEYRFGAIAFSSTTHRLHIRWNVSDPERADLLATRYCNAADCSVVLRFGPGRCGTFSLGDGGALGVGLGNTENEAASTARANCAQSGQSCKVAPVRCNDQS